MKQITLNVIELPNSDMEYHILMDVMESGMQVIWHYL